MRVAGLLVFAALGLAAADRGLPVRLNVADYPAHAEAQGIVVAADALDRDQVRSSFSTDLSEYAVFEVAVYPKKDTPLDLSTIDFALRVDGRIIRPVEPRAIAGINQRKGQARSRDITLYPTVGVTTGSWGTGTMAGVGVGVGGNAPGPASSDSDRRTMEMELSDKGLQDAMITAPVAGYLYFPIGKRKVSTYELEYSAPAADVKLSLPAPKK